MRTIAFCLRFFKRPRVELTKIESLGLTIERYRMDDFVVVHAHDPNDRRVLSVRTLHDPRGFQGTEITTRERGGWLHSIRLGSYPAPPKLVALYEQAIAQEG